MITWLCCTLLGQAALPATDTACNCQTSTHVPGLPACCAPQAALVQQWLSLDQGVKQQIKQSLLATLGAQVSSCLDCVHICRCQQRFLRLLECVLDFILLAFFKPTSCFVSVFV